MVNSPLLKETYFQFASSIPKIGNFDSVAEFEVQILALMKSVVSLYGGLRVNVPHQQSILLKQGRITSPAKIGFDILTAIDSLSSSDAKSALNNYSSAVNEDYFTDDEDGVRRKSLLYENVVYQGLLSEYDLQSKLHMSEATFLMDPLVKWSWIRKLGDHRVVYPKPVIDAVTNTRIWHDHNLTAWTTFMDLNMKFRNANLSIFQPYVKSQLSIPSVSDNKTLTDVLAAQEVNRNTYSTVHAFGSAITAGHTPDFINDVVYHILYGRWAEMTMEFDFDRTEEMTVFFDCIAAKLLTPLYVWEEQTAIDIDNYIAVYLLPRS